MIIHLIFNDPKDIMTLVRKSLLAYKIKETSNHKNADPTKAFTVDVVV